MSAGPFRRYRLIFRRPALTEEQSEKVNSIADIFRQAIQQAREARQSNDLGGVVSTAINAIRELRRLKQECESSESSSQETSEEVNLGSSWKSRI